MERTDPPPPGVYHDIPFQEYLAWDAFSKSQVPSMLRSPKHWQRFMASPPKTDALRQGSVTDCLVFEPHLFDSQYWVKPAEYVNDKGESKKWSGNANVCKDATAKAAAAGKVAITRQEKQLALLWKRAVMNHRTAKQFLNHGTPQVSCVWVDPDTGVTCKCRFDWLSSPIVDLKTTVDASLDGFPREANKYFYYVQGAMYSDAWFILKDERKAFMIVAVEKSAPFCVGVYHFGNKSLTVGRKQYKRALSDFATMKRQGRLWGYSDFAEAVDIPHWAIYEEMGEELDDAIGF